MKITIVADIQNGMELKRIFDAISAKYVDGIGAYCLPAQKKFGLDIGMNIVNARHPDSVITVEFDGIAYSGTVIS